MGVRRVQQITEWLAEDHLAEPATGLSSVEHAVQTAELALRDGADSDLIIAALLHDVGQAEAGEDHGRWATLHLSGWFSERTLWLIEHHITAKRYVSAVAPHYLDSLSPTARRSLDLQGGPLLSDAACEFSRHPWFDDVMRLREWDDAAKRVGFMPRPLDAYTNLLLSEMARVNQADALMPLLA